MERSIKEIKKLFDGVFGGLKLDILSYETAFSWVSNELNNIPICLGNRYKNLERVELITPNRLMLGRNNSRSMSGEFKIQQPTRLMKQLELVFEAWWKVWASEKILDFVPQPPKWTKNSGQVSAGDIVLFPKDTTDGNFDVVWKLGRVNMVMKSKDGKIRKLRIEYKNENESVFRKTDRAAREVAVLHHEGDVVLVEQLNAAAKSANLMMIQRSPLVHPWPQCQTYHFDQLSSFRLCVCGAPTCWDTLQEAKESGCL